MNNCIRIDGRRLTLNGKPITLKGVNLGSWINIEDFMIGLSGTDWQIRAAFQREFGDDFTSEFFQSYHKHFMNEKDIKAIAAMGFNVVRVPFNYRYFESDLEPSVWRESGFALLNNLFDWCDSHNVFVLLDFHAAPGGQNTTPPSDSTTGYPQLWSVRHFQDRTVALWQEMARRYRSRPSLFGYNLLNEPITCNPSELTREQHIVSMNHLNHRMIQAISAIDPDHVIVIEGDVRSSGGFATLDPELFTRYPNTMLTYHHYPLAAHEYSVNVENERPDFADHQSIKSFLIKQIRAETDFASLINRPVLLGEFGHGRNDRSGKALAVTAAQLDIARELEMSWTLWSYKDVGRAGLMAPREDQSWVQFVSDPDVRGPITRCQESRAKHFDDIYIANLGKNERNRLIYDAAWNDEVRGLRRVALEYEIRRLAELPREKILAMPASFDIDNCARAEPSYEVLKRFL